MKTKHHLCLIAIILITFFSLPVQASQLTFKVTLTNLSANVLLTPPIFATTKHKADVYELTQPASEELEMLAEGGSTDGLASMFEAHGAFDVVQTETPVLPGESITVELRGRFRSYFNVASMILPTNDGFIALSGRKMKRFVDQTFYLHAYDAGSEFNDEICGSIPGPQCNGEGYNSEGGEGFVFPHPGIHGEGELSRAQYSWADPVAKITVSFGH